MHKKFLLILLTILLGSTMAYSQVTVSPFGVSPRDADEDLTGFFDLTYNGLTNVGVETKIYLLGEGNVTFTTPTWTLTSQPATSVAALGTVLNADTNMQYISFTPDVAGKYVIEFADGAETAEITINAGLYLGLETANCVLCHTEYVDMWSETGHADMLERGLEGTLSSHYGEGCISCHTTGFDANANNDGFDDRTFTFPALLGVGVYDQAVADFPDAMQLANIQCESCHGPGSSHGGAVSMSTSIATDNCAWCHDSGTHHVFPEQWDHSGHDATEFDERGFHGGHAVGAFVGYAGNRSGCSQCHSGSAFVSWIKADKGDFETPVGTNISCAACHDPHDDTNIHQLRTLETTLGDGTLITEADYGTGALCMNCHKSRREAATYAIDVNNGSSHYGAHHGPQADMLLGKNAPDFGVELKTSPHGVAIENACVGCHMTGEHTDELGNVTLVGGHSFNMNDANGNDHVEACADCHGDVGATFAEKKYYINGNADLDNDGTAEGLQVEVKGLLAQLAELLPQDESGDVLIDGDGLTVADMMGGYVYFWVMEDRSFGVHNPAYTISLLKAAIETMGGVTSIEFPDDAASIPSDFELAQNYPNPFNPETKIRFTIPEASNVKVTVYDALGKEIAELINSELSAGTHEVTWRAQNVASGIYFYRMQSSNFVSIKKMILLK